jgi:hypothetical protein
MTTTKHKMYKTLWGSCAFLWLFVFMSFGYAQRGGQAGPPQTAKAAAPVDLTGTWVPLITEDWRVRMVTPKKGDYESVPISPEGRRVADAWDPAKDEAATQQCKAYGAAALMRVPGRIRISWENDTTLKIEAEAGTQTRHFQFIPPTQQPPAVQPSLQGQSVASWELVGGRGAARAGNLKVVTRSLSGGYLRKNGVPYSANAVVTEWFDVITAAPPNNATYLVIDTEVYDPLYLTQPFVTSTHFRKLPANAPFNPEACSAR